jgi:hypothetical protein
VKVPSYIADFYQYLAIFIDWDFSLLYVIVSFFSHLLEDIFYYMFDRKFYTFTGLIRICEYVYEHLYKCVCVGVLLNFSLDTFKIFRKFRNILILWVLPSRFGRCNHGIIYSEHNWSTGKWMDLENIILSKVSQAQKAKNHYVLPYMGTLDLGQIQQCGCGWTWITWQGESTYGRYRNR